MKYLQEFENKETDEQIEKRYDMYSEYLKEKFSKKNSAAALHRLQSSEITKVSIIKYYLKKRNVPNAFIIIFHDIKDLLNSNNFQSYLNIIDYFKNYSWEIMIEDGEIELTISRLDDKFFENLEIEMSANKYNL